MGRKQKRVRVRRSAEEWSGLVEAWERGGLSADEFASEHELNAGTLRWWRTRLKIARVATTSEQSSQVRLVPLEIAEGCEDQASSRPLGWELHFADGHHLRAYSELTASTLRAVLIALGAGRRARR